MFIPKSNRLKRGINPVKIRALKRLQGKKKLEKPRKKTPKFKINRSFFNKIVLQKASKDTFHTFACDTSIHGLKHIFVTFDKDEVRGKHKKSILNANKIIWVGSVLTSFAFCLSLMSLAYISFFSTLTTTSIESINYPISEVAFPAVTFCSVNKVYKPNIQMIHDIA